MKLALNPTSIGIMEKLTFDVAVIGFGKAGKTIAMKRAAAGDKVAVIETDPMMYGGTCINIGCVPTKHLLTESSRGTNYIDAKTKRNAFISKLNAANKNMVEGKGALVITGAARFVSEKTITVGDQLEITAETIIINTGATSGITVTEKIHDSTSIQQLDKTPQTLAIVGAGPIGLEFATMFNQFGTKVRVYKGTSPFLPKIDRDIAEAVRSHLESQGIEIIDEKITDPNTLSEELVLMAIGRRPAVTELALENAGIEYNERGIKVNEYCETNIPGVYAVGDVNGGPQFTYISYDDHRVVMSHRWGDQIRTTQNRVIPTSTFIDPPLSSVGLTEEQARENHNVSVRKANIADIPILPRPKILGKPQGIAKFLVDADTNQILGATLFCIDSQELINTIALAIKHQIPAKEVGEGIYTHPATSEVFNALLV